MGWPLLMNSEEREVVGQIIQSYENPVVVELGAYHGEEGPIFESLSRSPLTHVMVEADPANCAYIEDNVSYHLNGRRRLMRGAVAQTDGYVTFYPSKDSRDGATGSGSTMRPSGHLQHFPTIKFGEGIQIPAYTLDYIFVYQGLSRIDLLWVDIQGAEREMIAGAQHALAFTRWLFMEAEEIQMYHGQALKNELIAMLPGWKLERDFGFNILLRNLDYNA